jgi:hypothetical protein
MNRAALLSAVLTAWIVLTPWAANDLQQERVGLFHFTAAEPFALSSQLAGRLAVRLPAEFERSGFSFKVYPIPFDSLFQVDSLRKEPCRIALHGQWTENTLDFKILDLKSGEESGKIIPIAGISAEDITQIILLKSLNFISQSVLSQIQISSNPLGCQITINGDPAGLTPREFYLPHGLYDLSISGDFLATYREKIAVTKGINTKISPNMQFKGYPTHYWMLGALISTWQLGVILFLENRLEKEYHNLSNDKPDSDLSNERRALRNTAYFRDTFISLAGIGWIGTGFSYYINKKAKKRLFNRK